MRIVKKHRNNYLVILLFAFLFFAPSYFVSSASRYNLGTANVRVKSIYNGLCENKNAITWSQGSYYGSHAMNRHWADISINVDWKVCAGYNLYIVIYQVDNYAGSYTNWKLYSQNVETPYLDHLSYWAYNRYFYIKYEPHVSNSVSDSGQIVLYYDFFPGTSGSEPFTNHYRIYVEVNRQDGGDLTSYLMHNTIHTNINYLYIS
ncbi:MAG: hypothetical protein OEZ01_05455 [Candidatus Heimdallarchaeota archaeon]|nr:hypothetical protein [Candidatus Heimdallarchaeota archaeon]MDH5645430.1 hypothetical protein [Candidatus Heimdallarchaeota archaeon]